MYGPVHAASGDQAQFFQAGNSSELVRVIEIRLVIGPGCRANVVFISIINIITSKQTTINLVNNIEMLFL